MSITRRAIAITAIAAASLTGVTLGTADAAVPTCGGNQKIETAPYSCTQTRTIQGFNLTVLIEVSDVGHAVITYTLDKPAPQAFPIKVRWHEGLSSTAPLTVETQGTFAKGATSAVLELTKCGNGQLGGQMDVKAVFIANGDERGRVTAPYIAVPATCGLVATTTTTAPVVSVSGVSTVPTASSASTVATGVSAASARVVGTLPKTGDNSKRNAGYIAVVLVGGLALIYVGRKRAER